jgi:orotate phosphoribosyltransferase
LFNYHGGKIQKANTAIVVDDVLTTGGSILKVVHSLRKMNVETLAIAAIYNRGHDNNVSGIPIISLEHKYLPTYSAEDCPDHLEF